MRTLIITAFVISLLASCQKDAVEIPQTGNPGSLETKTVILSQLYTYNNLVSVTCGQTLILDAGFSISGITPDYLWQPGGDTTSRITLTNIPDNSVQVYTVEITFDTLLWTTLYVNVRGWYEPEYEVPMAFTPNGDRVNDIFYATAICFSSFDLKIFDTFSNHLIFESTDMNYGWDGTYKGKIMSAGEYHYQLELNSTKNTITYSTGYLQLIR